MNKPTCGKRYLQVFAFLQQFHANEDRLPTMLEICDQFGWASANSAHVHMRRLEQYRYIEKRGVHWRFRRITTSAAERIT